MFKHSFIYVLIALLFVVPAAAQDAVTANPTDCVTDYDESVDYFPTKAEIEDAEDFTVEYFNNYKVVTVTDAFDGAPTFSYVLVQCGTPAPDAGDFPEGTQFTEVPAADVITLTTTQLPVLEALDLLPALVGVDGFDFISSPSVRELIDAEELVAVGSGATINVERVLDLSPDLVLAYGFDPTTDAYPVLLDAGVFTAIDASWREMTPLGRAEWMKYTALFFNAEAAADEAYDGIVSSYEEAQELAASVPVEEQPVVLWNYFSPFTDSWTIPGAETYVGELTQDAGAQIALTELAPEDSVEVSFEVVYDGALDADIWIANAFGMNTYEDLLASDPRFADFSAAADDVWNNSLDVNAAGGNNYYELGAVYPNLVLRDLVAIFHPELLPDHEFVFFQPLD